MKQSFLKFTGKKFIAAAFLTASVLTAGITAKASVNQKGIEILSDDKTSVQFTGSTNDALLFNVHISNQAKENFTLTIKNSFGDELFSQTFSDADFKKQFKMLKNETASDRYYFTITSSDKNLNETYVINAVTRTVDDVVVNKL